MTDDQARDLSLKVLSDWQTALYTADLHLTKWRQMAVDGEYPETVDVAEQTANLAYFLCASLTIQKTLRERAFQ